MTEVVRVEGVRKAFGAVEVLRGVDLVVEDHEVVGLIGASGSGKSTLLRCIDLLETVDAGRIWVEGVEITAAAIDENAVRRRVGIVFQSFNLFPHMTVLRNVTLRTLDKSTAQTIVVRMVLDQTGTYSLVVVNPSGDASNAAPLKVN